MSAQALPSGYGLQEYRIDKLLGTGGFGLTYLATDQNLNLKVALKDPEFIKKEEALGAVVVTDKRVEPAEHKKFVQSEVARFGPVVKAAGAYAD